jgi:hypothetical protein
MYKNDKIVIKMTSCLFLNKTNPFRLPNFCIRAPAAWSSGIMAWRPDREIEPLQGTGW